MIGVKRFERTLAYVRRTGVPQELEELLRPVGKGGRPRDLAVDVLLAAMIVTYDCVHSLKFTQVHEVMISRLSRQIQLRHRIRTRQGRPITVEQVRYLWNAIADHLDYTTTRHPDLDPTDRELREATMGQLLDRLTGAASMRLPAAPAQAIDLTAIESAARSRSYGPYVPGASDSRPNRSADPDACWGHRTRTFNNKSKLVFGYQMLGAARASTVDGPTLPLLIERIRLVPGNKKGIPETIAMLDRLAAEGRKPEEILTDRGFSYSEAERWAIPLRERAIRQVLDMHPKDRGGRLHANDGYLMIDGWPHCPSTPDHLIKITRPSNLSIGERPSERGRRRGTYAAALKEWKKNKSELEDAKKLLAERAQYQFKRVGVTTAGNPRFTCPARTGNVVCHGCPLYPRGVPEGTGRPEVTAPSPAPKACAHSTITIDYTVDAKLRQDDYWLSDEWIKSYSRRSRIEAGFGLLKGTVTGGVQRGWTHQVGLVRTSLLLAIAVAATNLRQLLTGAKDTGDTRDELTQMDVTDYGFAEYDKDGKLLDDEPTPEEDDPEGD